MLTHSHLSDALRKLLAKLEKVFSRRWLSAIKETPGCQKVLVLIVERCNGIEVPLGLAQLWTETSGGCDGGSCSWIQYVQRARGRQ